MAAVVLSCYLMGPFEAAEWAIVAAVGITWIAILDFGGWGKKQ